MIQRFFMAMLSRDNNHCTADSRATAMRRPKPPNMLNSPSKVIKRSSIAS
jgi:hypothetical protein